jgi:ankyrin repeat protein
MSAVASDDFPFVERLVVGGTDVNTEDQYGRTALLFAVYDGSPMVHRLLAAGARPDPSQTEKAPLRVACGRGDISIAKDLLRAGADVNSRSYYADTPLMAAAYQGKPEMVAWLLHHGADPTLRNALGRTALTEARRRAPSHPRERAEYARVIAMLATHRASSRND